MKKLFILAAALTALMATLTSCGQGNAKLATDMDSLAYAIGTDLGSMAFQFDSTMNPQILAAAVVDAFNKNGKMTREEAGAFIQEYMTVGLARKNAAAGKKFIEDAIADGADTLASGLAYKIETPGTEPKAALGDTVYVKYTLSLPNGQVISETGDTPTSFLLQEGSLIKAWTQGVPLIGTGGKITLYTPASLAYGEMGFQGIGPNQALKFDIELVKVATPAAPATK